MWHYFARREKSKIRKKTEEISSEFGINFGGESRKKEKKMQKSENKLRTLATKLKLIRY